VQQCSPDAANAFMDVGDRAMQEQLPSVIRGAASKPDYGLAAFIQTTLLRAGASGCVAGQRCGSISLNDVMTGQI